MKVILEKKLNVLDGETISEMCTFVSKGSSYEASGNNHDDLVMNLVLFAWFTSTDIFQGITDIDMKNLLYRDKTVG